MEGNKEEYIRVGTCLYKIAQQPLANGTCTLRRIPWSFGTIRQDYGKNNTPLFGNMTVFVLFPAIPIIIKRLAVSIICMSPLTTYHQKESFQTL